jgi:hypothetical protein
LWADTTVRATKALLVPLEATTFPLQVPPPKLIPPLGLKSTTFSIMAHCDHPKPNPPGPTISLCLTNVLRVKMPKPEMFEMWTSSMVPDAVISPSIPISKPLMWPFRITVSVKDAGGDTLVRRTILTLARDRTGDRESLQIESDAAGEDLDTIGLRGHLKTARSFVTAGLEDAEREPARSHQVTREMNQR